MKRVQRNAYPLRRRKRRKKKSALLILIVITILSVSLLFSSGRAADVEQYTEFLVEPGDTLWGIARKNLPSNMDIRQYVYEIAKVNEVENSIIYPGKVLLLPQ